MIEFKDLEVGRKFGLLGGIFYKILPEHNKQCNNEVANAIIFKRVIAPRASLEGNVTYIADDTMVTPL